MTNVASLELHGNEGCFSPSEWDARVELAGLYRALHLYGMTDLIYNHITLRVPDEPCPPSAPMAQI